MSSDRLEGWTHLLLLLLFFWGVVPAGCEARRGASCWLGIDKTEDIRQVIRVMVLLEVTAGLWKRSDANKEASDCGWKRSRAIACRTKLELSGENILSKFWINFFFFKHFENSSFIWTLCDKIELFWFDVYWSFCRNVKINKGIKFDLKNRF